MKVLVGLSGGVDSAIAAYLLKQQGYDVTCCFMRNWDALANQDILGNPTIMDDICPQEVDYNDARIAAEKLGLPLLRVDFIKEYWDYVFESFISEYKRGRTPNPDILCNKYIKFASFVDYAKQRGFDKVATGHYAKIVEDDGVFVMHRAKDEHKDQTYFLSQINADVLSYTLFPLGDIDKPTVRNIAHELDLNIADKKDSTGICFIGERNFKEFLSNYLPSKKGDIVDINSQEILGKHSGVLYYTIGQRKGLGIGGTLGPWFVVGKDVVTNTLYVANKSDDYWLTSDQCLVTDVNWLTTVQETEFSCTAKFRYRQKDHPVSIKKIDDTTVMVSYPQGINAVTQGQQAVFYQGDVVLGGGVIDEVYKEGKSLEVRLKTALT